MRERLKTSFEKRNDGSASSRRVKTFEPSSGLTRADLVIIEHVAAGYSNREIADRLSKTEADVDHDIRHLLTRVTVSGRLELALYALENGLIPVLG